MRVVFLGDSVTAGVGLSDGQPTYVQLLDAHCRRCGVSVECIASALDGIDTGYALKRFGRMVTALDPDWVVVMLGLNDAQPAGQRVQITPAEFQNNLLGLVDRILGLGARPVLVAPNPRIVCRAGDTPRQLDLMPPYVAALRQTAEAADLPWVDLYARFRGDDWSELLPDGVHPGAAGHRLIADTLAAELACFWPSPRVGESTRAGEDATTNERKIPATARE
jgi:lysophospholipase L1-like esterase